MLDEGIHQYHTFKITEKKTLRAVLRGIPKTLFTDEIKHSLRGVGSKVISVCRMQKIIERTRSDMLLILVQLVSLTSNTNTDNLIKPGHMLIKVETQKARSYIPRCHRHQKYGQN